MRCEGGFGQRVWAKGSGSGTWAVEGEGEEVVGGFSTGEVRRDARRWHVMEGRVALAAGIAHLDEYIVMDAAQAEDDQPA